MITIARYISYGLKKAGVSKQLLRQSPKDCGYSSSTFKAMTCSILFRAILHGWHM